MKPPDTANQAAERQGSIVVCTHQPERGLAYLAALQAAGYAHVSYFSPNALPKAKTTTLLVCETNSQEGEALWETIAERLQPQVGTIVATEIEDPRWVVRCIRKGALNCHLASEDHSALVEIVDECLQIESKAASQQKTSHLARRLKEAIDNEIIDVHFQPIVETQSWRIKRVEALARWSDGALGHITPTEFIATAEEEGLVEELGQLILRKSIAALSQARQSGYPLQYSINLSRRQLDNPNLVKDYQRIVQQNGEDPSRITLEVTETARYENQSLAVSLMNDFIEAGFAIAIDDFGTGESAFAQMLHVDYDELKIDRSLISCLSQPPGRSVVKSIIEMGKALGMRIVAEGVEDRHTAELLRSLEVDYCQGYYFAKPMPMERLIAYLQSNGPTQTGAN